jgi:para-aminobenzoate synthetase component 1
MASKLSAIKKFKMFVKEINYQKPLEFASQIINDYCFKNPEDSFVFLNSKADDQENYLSYLGLFSRQKITGNNFNDLKKTIENSKDPWFGYLAYENLHHFEKIKKTKKSFIDLNEIHFEQYHLVLEFDQKNKKLTLRYSDKTYLDLLTNFKIKKTTKENFKITKFSSNFSDENYLKTIKKIQKKISDGDIFQMNLTRKFFGNFSKKISPNQAWQWFKQTQNDNPTNYSAFFKFEKKYILCNSPELFFKISDNHISSCPIKGTINRSNNKSLDQKNQKILKNSAKELSENLMITDLVRSDISKVCIPGSVEVKNLFKLSSLQNIHHLSSLVTGKLAENINNFQAIPALFPAGSMTGAPKVHAMKLIANYEKINRGIYSGAIGVIEGKNQLNLAVVIRTLIICANKFEMQFGGGITYNSIPQDELFEVYSKAKTWFKILKLTTKKKF